MKHVYVTLVVPLSILIPIIAGFSKKVFHDKPLRIILFYLLFVAGMIVPIRLLGSRNINNLPLLHVYTIIELIMISCFFFEVLDKRFKNTVISIGIIFSVCCILNFVYVQELYIYNSYSRPVEAIIVILYGMLYLFSESASDNSPGILRQPNSWVVIGLLIYFSSAIFYFAFLNILNDNAEPKLYFLMGKIHATLVLLMYLLFCRGFLAYKNE